MNKMVIMLALIVLVPLKVQASPQYIDDFDGIGNNLSGSWSIADTRTQNYTAEASSYGMELSPSNTYTMIAGGWSFYHDVVGDYLGFYLYCSDGSAAINDTLSIAIIEGDYDSGTKTDVYETWELTTAIDIDWTGWKYKMVHLPNDIELTGATGTGDGIFTPVAPGGGDKSKGATSIQFTVNNGAMGSYYVIDEINICQCVTIAEVLLTFPQNGDSSFRVIPPTISAVCDINTDVTNSFSQLFLTQKDENLADLKHYSIDGLTSLHASYPGGGLTANDGVSGLFATPDDKTSDAGGWGAYQEGASFVMFIRPANIDGDIGQAKIIAFSMNPPPLRLKTRYRRDLTE